MKEYGLSDMLKMMIESQKVHDEGTIDKVYDLIGEYSPETFTSIIGTLMDMYEANNPGFDAVQELKILANISEEIHKEYGKLTNTEEGTDNA